MPAFVSRSARDVFFAAMVGGETFTEALPAMARRDPDFLWNLANAK